MSRKRVVILGVLAGSLFLLGYLKFRAIVGYPIPPESQFALVWDGMAQSEVIEILGPPTRIVDRGTYLVWEGSDGGVGVRLDANGRVTKREYHRDPETWQSTLWNKGIRQYVPAATRP
jgi:hypothetical protein